MSLFGDRLRALRQEKSITQAELSKIIGISKSSINMYERGEREPNFGNLNALADFFNCSVDYLLGRVEYPELVVKKVPDGGGFIEYAIHKDSPELTEKEIRKLREFLETLNSSQDDSKNK